MGAETWRTARLLKMFLFDRAKLRVTVNESVLAS